jgi:hypothetical protein
MKRQAAIAISLLALLAMAGCVSKPKPKPSASPTPVPTATATPTPQETPAPTAVPVPGPELEKAQAQELRQKCIDYGLNESMRDDYLIAEDSYKAGVDAFDSDAEASKASFIEAIGLYADILDRGLTALAEENKDKAGQMREAALGLGADGVSADALELGDQAFARGDGAEDSETALAAYHEALVYFEIAYNRTAALNVKAEIDGRDYVQYDPGNYELAEGKLADSDQAFPDDLPGSLDAVQEALLRYNLVLKKGWEFALGMSRGNTEAERQKADEIKSEVAVPGAYQEAAGIYDEAADLEAREQFAEADEKYAQSAQLFQDAYAQAKEKMDGASGALERLRAKREESMLKAKEADSKVNSGAKEGAK